MSSAKVNPYQVLLLDQNSIRFHKKSALSPANLLLDSDPNITLTCLQMTDMVLSVRHDLIDILLVTPGEVLFTYGSSFFRSGIRHAGDLEVSQDKTI